MGTFTCPVRVSAMAGDGRLVPTHLIMYLLGHTSERGERPWICN
ncbi:MAG: hypothetical protein OXI03_08015 [Chloroflexota bacterium]|nr:hypothetical protein [Chloroflexota bacterium]